METGELVHWYETRMSKEMAESIISQIQSMQSLFQSRSLFFVPVLDSWYDLETGYLITIMEAHSDANLAQFLQEQRKFGLSSINNAQKQKIILENLIQVLNVLCVALPSMSLPCILSSQFTISNDHCIRFLLNPLHLVSEWVVGKEEATRYLSPEFGHSSANQESSLVYSIGILLCEVATFQVVYAECTSKEDLLSRKANVHMLSEYTSDE